MKLGAKTLGSLNSNPDLFLYNTRRQNSMAKNRVSNQMYIHRTMTFIPPVSFPPKKKNGSQAGKQPIETWPSDFLAQ